jgi:peptide/nickel transport system permease protein
MNGFSRFLVQRFLLALFSIWAIATITFFMSFLAPGDPALLRFGEKSSPAAIQRFRHVHGLDLPPVIRYERYLTGVVRCDFGLSYQNDEPVSNFFDRAFPKTMTLATLAIILALLVGVFAGTIAASNANGWLDRSLMALTLAGIGIPSFVLAPFLVYIFALSLPKMFPNLNVEWPPVVWAPDDPLSLLLPVVVLASRPAALIARMTRSSLLEVKRQDFIRTARAKGLSPSRILFVHCFKNAFLPVLTSAGTAFGFLLSGSFVVETIFAVPGIGAASVSSFTTRDYPLIQGTTFVLATIFVVVNLAVDILYAALDPRTRAASGGLPA